MTDKPPRGLPIGPDDDELMEALATLIDTLLSRKGRPRKNFVLITFTVGGKMCNFISNADREDVETLLREYVAGLD